MFLFLLLLIFSISLRTIEYSGYTRTGICKFPVLSTLNKDADKVMICFKKFLEELKEGIVEKKNHKLITQPIHESIFYVDLYNM